MRVLEGASGPRLFPSFSLRLGIHCQQITIILSSRAYDVIAMIYPTAVDSERVFQRIAEFDSSSMVPSQRDNRTSTRLGILKVARPYNHISSDHMKGFQKAPFINALAIEHTITLLHESQSHKPGTLITTNDRRCGTAKNG
jgi:hypothetical protein